MAVRVVAWGPHHTTIPSGFWSLPWPLRVATGGASCPPPVLPGLGGGLWGLRVGVGVGILSLLWEQDTFEPMGPPHGSAARLLAKELTLHCRRQ